MSEHRIYVRDRVGRFAETHQKPMPRRSDRIVTNPNATAEREIRMKNFEAKVRRHNARKAAAGGIVQLAAQDLAAKKAGTFAVKGKKLRK